MRNTWARADLLPGCNWRNWDRVGRWANLVELAILLDTLVEQQIATARYVRCAGLPLPIAFPSWSPIRFVGPRYPLFGVTEHGPPIPDELDADLQGILDTQDLWSGISSESDLAAFTSDADPSDTDASDLVEF